MTAIHTIPDLFQSVNKCRIDGSLLLEPHVFEQELLLFYLSHLYLTQY